MASNIVKHGNRLFAAGSIAVIVVALLHGIGDFAPPSADAALSAVCRPNARLSPRPGAWGMRPSFMDIHMSLSLTKSIMLLLVGVQNLVTLRVAGDEVRLVRCLSLVDSIFVGGLVVLFAVCRIPPPLVSLAVVEALFLLALIFCHRQPQ